MASLAKMFTAAEVMEALGVCRPTLYRLVANGELAATRVGARYRFTACDVSAFLEAARTTPQVKRPRTLLDLDIVDEDAELAELGML